MEKIPSEIILFFVGQTGLAAWSLITMFFDMKAMKGKMTEMDEENKELRHDLKNLNDTLLIVKNNTELLLLGRIKTQSSKI